MPSRLGETILNGVIHSEKDAALPVRSCFAAEVCSKLSARSPSNAYGREYFKKYGDPGLQGKLNPDPVV